MTSSLPKKKQPENAQASKGEADSGPKPSVVPPIASPTQKKVAPIRDPASRARLRGRHGIVLLSFLVLVILPIVVAGWYLWVRAADQYASYVGFSVRKEETSSAVELLGGITELSGSSSSDTDILYKFLQSQEIVRRIDAKLDLRQIWSKGDPQQDPVFAYHPSGLFNYDPPGTIEDLTEHWLRKVKVYYDEGSGLIDLRVLAFTPDDAQAIAEEIFEESSRMINELSDIAREDAMRYAREELEESVIRLKEKRRIMTEFRNKNRIVDPEASIQGQVGLITTLQNELATALIELDMLQGTAQPNDPRIQQTQRRIKVIENRIDQERRKFGNGSAPGDEGSEEAYAELLGTYETLVVDRQFAEESYRLALAAFDTAQAEARRQSRYLAAHVAPTLAEKSKFPDRPLQLGVIAIFSFLLWATIVLIGYSLKDRR